MTDYFKKFDPEKLYFVPLGGCHVYGSNVNMYYHKGKWLVVDFGMGFADDTMPGVDILLPDPAFLEEKKADVVGMILTHGHEDHIGAIEHFWHRIKCQMYATPFTAALIRGKFKGTNVEHSLKLTVVPQGAEIDLPPFKIKMIKMAHSIPEMQLLAITAGGHTIVHTGDWKVDPEPLESNVTDEAALKELGDKGVLALVGDSTNAMVPGHSGSEMTVMRNMTDLFSEFKHRIIVTCLSSNVSRFHAIYEAAQANGRQVALVGRSMQKVDEAARETGYLQGIPPFLSGEAAGRLPRDKIVYVCTGSQGEPRAAMARIAHDEHRDVFIEEGDAVIFSARVIPGNEKAIERVKNLISSMGATIINNYDAPIHVSGHPYRDELKKMYAWIRPKIAIPVHGEAMQLERHADLAQDCGVGEVIIPYNGNVIELSTGVPIVVGNVKAGVLAIEGKRIVAIDHNAILTRRRIMTNGSAVVTIVMNAEGDLVADPKITAMGLLDEDSEIDNVYIAAATKAVKDGLLDMPRARRANDIDVSEVARVSARRYFQEHLDRKPQTRVHLVRV